MNRRLISPEYALYAARALEAAAFSSVMPFLLLHFMENFKLSASTAGAVMSLREIIPIFTALGFGYLATRLSRKHMLTVSIVILGLAAVEFWLGRGGMGGLYAAALLSGAAISAMRIAFSSSIPDVLGEGEYSKGYALLHASINLGCALGPLASSYWIMRKDYSGAFLVSIPLYIISAFSVAVFLPPSPKPSSERSSNGLFNFCSGLGGAGWFFLTAIFVVTIINGLRLQMNFVGLAKYFVDYFHSTRAASFYWAFQSLLATILLALGGRKMNSWPLPRLFWAFTGGSLLIALGNISLIFFSQEQATPAFLVMLLLTTAGEVLLAPALGTIYVRIAGRGHSGFLFGISNTCMSLGLAFGSAYGGIVMDRAIALRDLPLYWRFLALVYLPLSLACLALGSAALRRYSLPERKLETLAAEA